MTDYNLPEWWHDDEVTAEDKDRWFKEERSRRRLMKQDMKGFRMITQDAKREQRKEYASGGAVKLEDMR
jgi:hypothetical protein